MDVIKSEGVVATLHCRDCASEEISVRIPTQMTAIYCGGFDAIESHIVKDDFLFQCKICGDYICCGCARASFLAVDAARVLPSKD